MERYCLLSADSAQISCILLSSVAFLTGLLAWIHSNYVCQSKTPNLQRLKQTLRRSIESASVINGEITPGPLQTSRTRIPSPTSVASKVAEMD